MMMMMVMYYPFQGSHKVEYEAQIGVKSLTYWRSTAVEEGMEREEECQEVREGQV